MIKKDNVYRNSGNRNAPNLNYFTGIVKMKDISKNVKSKDQKIYHVTFMNGARTKLHYHTGGQVLIVTKGKGSLVIYKKLNNKNSNFKIKQTKKIILNIGDVVYIPAKTLHTHGSTNKKQLFSHIAINNNNSCSGNKKKTAIESKAFWYESDFKTLVTAKLK